MCIRDRGGRWFEMQVLRQARENSCHRPRSKHTRALGRREPLGEGCSHFHCILLVLTAQRCCFRTQPQSQSTSCLLYTSDAADEEDSVDLGGRRFVKKKK
eukprot:TRINITY_DN3633_c0_g1_i2.p1 TRINITY_DN3633_c0_g1~~TRINITY_DN3633_c0_g1_i2.p1  ORF type:complete len:100 (+),score=12.66 TRINITY_DN3633_c0_g1_i2:71-370(+)